MSAAATARRIVSPRGRSLPCRTSEPGERDEAGRLLLPVAHDRQRAEHEVRTRRARRGGRAPGRSCRGPCRRPGSRRGRGDGGTAATRGRGAGTGAGWRTARRGPRRRRATCRAGRRAGRPASRRAAVDHRVRPPARRRLPRLLVELGGEAQQAEDATARRARRGARPTAARARRTSAPSRRTQRPPTSSSVVACSAARCSVVSSTVVSSTTSCQSSSAAAPKPAGALAGGRGRGADLRPAAGELLGDEHLDAGGAHVVVALEHQRGLLDVDRRVRFGERRRPRRQERGEPAGGGVGRGARARRARPVPPASGQRSRRSPRRRRRRCTSATGRRRRPARGSPASRRRARRGGRGAGGRRRRAGRRRAGRCAPARRRRPPAPGGRRRCPPGRGRRSRDSAAADGPRGARPPASGSCRGRRRQPVARSTARAATSTKRSSTTAASASGDGSAGFVDDERCAATPPASTRPSALRTSRWRGTGRRTPASACHLRGAAAAQRRHDLPGADQLDRRVACRGEPAQRVAGLAGDGAHRDERLRGDVLADHLQRAERQADVGDRGVRPRSVAGERRAIDVRRLPPVRLAAGCQASNPSRAQVSLQPSPQRVSADGGAIRPSLRRGCQMVGRSRRRPESARRAPVLTRPGPSSSRGRRSAPATDADADAGEGRVEHVGAVAGAVHPGVDHLGRAYVWPAATFSPHVRQVYPAAVIRCAGGRSRRCRCGSSSGCAAWSAEWAAAAASSERSSVTGATPAAAGPGWSGR